MTTPVAAFVVTLDGTDLSDRLRPRLISLTLSEKRGTDADQLDIVLSDADGRLALPRLGAELALKLGWAQGSGVTPGLIDKGRYTVDEVEHAGTPDVVTLRARSADFAGAARQRKLRSWRDTTLGAIVTELAGDNGLKAQVAPDLAGLAVAVLAQGRMSDLGLIRSLGKKYDAVATVKAGRLLFARVGKGTTASGATIPAATIARGDGDSHVYRRAARDEYSGATAAWHDPATATRKEVVAGDAAKARKLKRTYGSEADARAAAEAERTRQQRSVASMTFTLALGRPDLYPEQRATLSGFKAEIDDQAWLIAEATHTLSADAGLMTSISLEAAV